MRVRACVSLSLSVSACACVSLALCLSMIIPAGNCSVHSCLKFKRQIVVLLLSRTLLARKTLFQVILLVG